MHGAFAANRASTGVAAPARFNRAHWLLFAVLLATSLIYALGLDGPYLFDDSFNLEPVRLWERGRLGWSEAMFGNVSGVLGRPVSMASFMLSAGLGSPTPLDYKLGNLLIHLICAVLIYRLLRRLLAGRDAALAAVALTALWALHPLHVSTVLYAIQRMAQLSSLFALACVLAYLRGRDSLRDDRKRAAGLWLFVAFPLLWIAGLFSKENAAVAPLLCLVLEIAYFQRTPASKRWLSAFYAATLLLPAIAAAWILAFKPGTVLAGYAIRDFGMPERLLSQSRALVDYLGMLAVPRAERMGLFADDFATSHGLFSPPTTAAAIVFLSAASIGAIALKRKAPHIFAGWFFFLFAHSVESSILPLELYYEHRNYLPSVGLLLMLAGLIGLLPAGWRSRRRVRFGIAGLWVAACIALATIAAQQTQVWRSKDLIVEQALRGHPESVRARQAKFVALVNKRRYDEAEAVLRPLESSAQPRSRLLTELDLLSVACLRGSGVDPNRLDRAVADAQPRLTIGEMQSVGLLMQVTDAGRCPALNDAEIAGAVAALAEAASEQGGDILPKWQLRYAAASIYARSGHWPDALKQARLAAVPPAGIEVDGILIQALAHNGRLDEAREKLRVLVGKADPRDRRAGFIIERARDSIATSASPSTSSDTPPHEPHR
ncbi:hypothetical protein [Lysobacter enzymogenes]|uniref:hypothetical protein n=1 Tax=Lysobacter enzymogenes TaxID=69 RepID=UPI001A95C37C|nr:hypothetical protein [Lysobacter enzymogenes]QQP98504.1 hypothetical protein JHW38_11210 [Lysobacter enzymogenes]